MLPFNVHVGISDGWCVYVCIFVFVPLYDHCLFSLLKFVHIFISHIHRYVWRILLIFPTATAHKIYTKFFRWCVSRGEGGNFLCTVFWKLWYNHYETTSSYHAMRFLFDSIRFKAILIAKCSYWPNDILTNAFQRSTYLFERKIRDIVRDAYKKQMVHRPMSISCSNVTLIYLYFVGIKPIGASFFQFFFCSSFVFHAKPRGYRISTWKHACTFPHFRSILIIVYTKHRLYMQLHPYIYEFYMLSALINNTTLSFNVIEYTKLDARDKNWE